MNRRQLALAVGVPTSTLYEIVGGKYPCGIRTARKLAARTGRPFTEFLVMPGPEIEADLRRALEPKCTPEAGASAGE